MFTVRLITDLGIEEHRFVSLVAEMADDTLMVDAIGRYPLDSIRHIDVFWRREA